MSRPRRALPVLLALGLALPAAAQVAAPVRPEWVAASDRNARVLLDVMASFSPEGAGQLGVEGLEEEILDLRPRLDERRKKAFETAVKTLEARISAEKEPRVAEDLRLLVAAGREALRSLETSRTHQLPYTDVGLVVVTGLRGLLEEPNSLDRDAQALTRLRKYAGLEGGKEARSLPRLAEDRIAERLSLSTLSGPPRDQLERSLAATPQMLAAVSALFQRRPITGWQEAVEALRKEMGRYDAFLREKVLPRARTDYRLPEAVYVQSLRQNGVLAPPDELAKSGRAAYGVARKQMEEMAARVAKENGISGGTAAVFAALRARRVSGNAVVPHYKKRIGELDEILRKAKFVTVPAREVRIRTVAEQQGVPVPAPYMQLPRLVGNTGETGDLVLPLALENDDSISRGADFTYEAATWTLAALEARPGHELQYAAFVNGGVSLARAVFGYNTVTAMGWALYAEGEIRKDFPLEGQLVSLQLSALRAARAFLEPALHAGTLKPAEVEKLLVDELHVSPALAAQEVSRYAFRSPGQAPAYLYSLERFREIRRTAETLLGPRFDAQRFHDFVLAQGLLPPDALKRAVVDVFVPMEKAPAR
ncbi:MAG: DUF885 domain-containing protein [Acidobacteria bacterium]|nr:DUF885 domain-containing protein [Acidobacteriota bacterium]